MKALVVVAALAWTSVARGDARPVTARESLGPRDSAKLCFRNDMDDEETAVRCGKPRTLKVPRRAFDEVRRVDVAWYRQRELALAIRIGEQWFLAATGVEHGSRDQQSGSYRITRASVRDVVPGGSPELVLQATAIQTTTFGQPRVRVKTTTDFLVVCGLGAGGQPSCVPFVVGLRRDDSEDPAQDFRLRLSPTFEAGAIVLTLEGEWPGDRVGVRREELEGAKVPAFR